MTRNGGFSLIEILIGMTIMGVLASIVLPALLHVQRQGVAALGKNDLADRAARLGQFVAEEIRMAGFMVGPLPADAAGAVPQVDHQSAGGSTAFPTALLPDNHDAADDSVTLLKGRPFFPRLAVAATAGNLITLDDLRSDTQIDVAAATSPYSWVVLENHKVLYQVLARNAAADTLTLATSLREPVGPGNEVFGVRPVSFFVETDAAGRPVLRYDTFAMKETLDNGVDGLQFEYLTVNEAGATVWQEAPDRPERIRAVRFHLLVRALLPEPDFRNDTDYSTRMGARVVPETYGPYHDGFRRMVVTELVEVKNNGL
jgi:prepilin-type N-terminal cleavage/methylation domain-containing protein